MSEKEINKQVDEYIKVYDIEEQLREKDKEIERLNNIINELNAELKRYKSIVLLCEKVRDSDKE